MKHCSQNENLHATLDWEAVAPNLNRHQLHGIDSDYDSDDRNSCRYGIECLRYDCHFDHPIGRPPPCRNPEFCENFNCTKLHAEFRTKACRFGANCNSISCDFLHPPKHAAKKDVTLTTNSRPCLSAAGLAGCS